MEDGSTLRDAHMSLWRQNFFKPEEMPEELKPVDCPDNVKYLWEYFLSMSKRRTSNGFGYNPLTDQQVESWARRRGITLLPFENMLLDELEPVFLSIVNKPPKKP